MDPSHLLSVSFTPVALISACGLITLALYNRLGAILARIRAFHQQKIELLDYGPEHDVGESQMLLDLLDSQIAKVTVKAKAIQKGLYCLLSAVFAFLLCSLFAAGAAIHERVGILAVVMHISGLCLFLVGIIWAIGELTHSLTPLEEESGYLEILTRERLSNSRTNSRNRKSLRMAKSA